MAATVGIPVHGGDISVKAGAAVVVGQVLTELTAADSGQPRTYIVGVGQLVATAAMQLLGGHSSYIVVSIACQRYCAAIVQLVAHTADTVAMVIRIGIYLGLSQLTIGHMGKRNGSRLVGKCIGGFGGVVTAHQIALNGLDYPSLGIVVIGGIDLLTATEYIHDGSRDTALGIVRSVIRILGVYIV